MKVEVIFNSGVSRIIECARFDSYFDKTLNFMDKDNWVIASIQTCQLAGWIDITSEDDGEPCGAMMKSGEDNESKN